MLNWQLNQFLQIRLSSCFEEIIMVDETFVLGSKKKGEKNGSINEAENWFDFFKSEVFFLGRKLCPKDGYAI